MSDLGQYVIDKVKELQEPLGLSGWSIQLETGPLEDAKASCAAEPEYRRALISFDPEKLETGDELDEIIVHEMTHIATWPLSKAVEDIANLAAGLFPEAMRAVMGEKLLEEGRYATEYVTTDVGFTNIRLLRRLWAAEKELADIRAELKAAKKAAKVAEMSVIG